jgi:hypothetical protein
MATTGKDIAMPAEETFEEQRVLILAPFLDMAEHYGVEEVARYMVHVGITVRDLDAAGGEVRDAIERHYRTSKGFDVDRAAHDLGTYPRIADAIRKLRTQKGHRREQNRSAKARSRKRASQQVAT